MIRAELARVAAALGADGAAFVLERPRDAGHGDLAPTSPWSWPSTRKTNPRAAGRAGRRPMLRIPPTVVAKTEIAGPGFINFWLAQDALATLLQTIIAAGPATAARPSARASGSTSSSSRPTPPARLHVGHGRGAAMGDAIAALLEWTGHAVTREFYINDAGVQIERVVAEPLGAGRSSSWAGPAAIPEGGYHGDYLMELAQALLAGASGAGRATRTRKACDACRSGALLIRQEQEDLLRDLRVCASMCGPRSRRCATRARWRRALALLAERGLTYEQDGALLLRTSDFGDDKDRVLRKSDGTLHLLRARHRLPHRQARARLRRGSSTCGAPITTATSRGCGRCSARWATARTSSRWRWCSW